MKVLTSDQIRAADQYTILHEPITSLELMERASAACANWILENLNHHTYAVFCGPGNNGGDGLAIARLLHQAEKNVQVFVVLPSDKQSPDNISNYDRLQDAGVPIQKVLSGSQIPLFDLSICVIDALLGTGLKETLKGLLQEVVAHLNTCNSYKIAIDLPSGMFSEHPSNKAQTIFQADVTLSFEVPKLNFLLPENSDPAGEWILLDIGLDKTFIEQQQTAYYLLERHEVQGILKDRPTFGHKGSFGHALLLAGSYGKVGAAVLASRACLRSGCGLVTTSVPQCAYSIMQLAAPEAMVLCSADENTLKGIPDLSPYASIGIGPGIGISSEATACVLELLKTITVPLVLDADALNILAGQGGWQLLVPKNAILTPHPGEFDRLFGTHADTRERISTQLKAAKSMGCCIVLKGHHSTIALPNGQLFFNNTGNSGMASGGNGDALTGLLSGLLAQGYSSEEACLLGVYLHGLAGDIACENSSPEALLASDLIEQLGAAFSILRKV